MFELRQAASRLLALVATALPVPGASAQVLNTSEAAQTLMVVLRESAGASRPDEILQPMGRIRKRVPDGRIVEAELSYFHYIGDMHLRFVFDRVQFMPSATPRDFARLDLDPGQALALALANIKRIYGNPRATPWIAGLMQVSGQSPDFDSSYFLDRTFWRELLKRHPDGLVAAVPHRSRLLFAPASDIKAVDRLRDGIARLHADKGDLRVSSALYLFKSDRWSVLQPPQAQEP